MTSSRWILNAAVAAPLGVAALSLPVMGAQAADIVDTIKQDQQFSTLAKAIDSAGAAPSLQGGGPYTVFAPTDQAFEQLPQGALEALMSEGNQDQLKKLLQYHVVDGKEIMAKDALGGRTEVDTASGDRLSVDGTGQTVLLVPAGLTQQADTLTDVTTATGMPATEHQEQVLANKPATEQQQTMPQGTGMPASPHQEQVLKDDGALREATVVEPDIQADNGVIHAIDAVLVPQSVLALIDKQG